MFDELYPINRGISNKVDSLVNGYQINEGEFEEENIITLEGMSHLYLLKQLKDNLQQKVIHPIYYYQVLVQQEENKKALTFHAEHALMRITTVWEHLFQILNTYLEIGMTPLKIKDNGDEWLIINDFSGSKKENNFKNSDKFLGRDNFTKEVKVKFTDDKNLRPIINLSNKQHWKKIRFYRNSIVHHKFLGQSMFVSKAKTDYYLMQVNNRAEETFNHDELLNYFTFALEDIKKALELTFLLFKKDLTPNEKLSSKETYFFLKIRCSCNHRIKVVPDLFYEFDTKLLEDEHAFHSIFCPNCLSDNIQVLEDKKEVSNKTWSEAFNEYYFNKIPLYLEKKLNE
ncbi:hypothetical protein [Priestia megaterium]|uniref:hypothetical protein n=1 Tax=Priestia megaterium TaxID=1404 RepID=UPI0011B3FC8B|nr:hypothetical protein [Priestia megaterium]QDZ88630.1 hypothetical protein D0441_30775 [Priestia megaterium]